MKTLSLIALVTIAFSSAFAIETNLPPELTELTKQYVDGFAPITEKQKTRTENLQRDYSVALTNLQQELMQSGDLDSVLAVKQELERLEYKQELGDDQKRGMFPKLLGLRENYDQGLLRINGDAEQQTRALTQQYNGNLQVLEKKLTQRGDLDAAVLVRAEQDKLIGAMPDLSKDFTSGKISVRAYIDGSDVIQIQGNKLWYEHKTADLPGKWHGHDEPTFINEDKWMPWWDGNTSRAYEKISPALRPQTNKRVYVTKKFGRGEVTLVEQPTQANNYTLKILVDDIAKNGADWYELQIKW